MKFRRTTRYPGGALGEISKAIAAIQSALEQLKAVYPIHLRPQGNSASIEFIGDYGGDGGTEGDYAFKLSATENMDGNGDPYDPPQFTVNVLGGTAQTLGGTPYFYEDVEIPDAEDGDYIFLRYQNVDLSYVEVGDWDSDIHYGTAAYIDNAYDGAPFDLFFVIGRVGSDYAGFVRQDHKGGIVMPAISNVVDIQTQLP